MTAPDDRGTAESSDRGVLQTAMRDAARTVQALEQQADAARASLDGAAAKMAEFGRWAAAAQQTIALHQEQERLVLRALEEARRQSDELLNAANARADDAVAAAKAAAEEILQSARATAGETLQHARESAEGVRRAAEQTAAERLSQLRAESDEIVEGAQRQVRDVRSAAEGYIAGITAHLEALVRDGEDAARGLEALARNHAESLQILMRLRSEARSQILPSVHRLLRGLKGEEAGDTGSVFSAGELSSEGGPSSPGGASQAGAGRPPEDRYGGAEWPAEGGGVAAAEHAQPVAVAEADDREADTLEDHTGDDSASPAHRTGQIIISPIYSFLQATRFMTALSHMPGVVSVKVRAYSGAKATIEVVTEGHGVDGIDCKAIAGFPVEVVESSDTRLVLRVGSLANRRAPG